MIERLVPALRESGLMLVEYASEHVLLCLIPALFIAGAVMVFLDQQSVLRYLGPTAPKPIAYGVASISGAVLAVCSCTVLPLFKGIYRKGAGLGPAIGFLYSGPAINVLAIVLTAKVLGVGLGVARALGAILFSVLIGFLMHLIFRKSDDARTTNAAMFSAKTNTDRPVTRTTTTIGLMIVVLLFLNWAPSSGAIGWWDLLHRLRYPITALAAAFLGWMLFRWYSSDERNALLRATWTFAVQVLPLLFLGVAIAGFLLGRPGHDALIPVGWITSLVGGNGVLDNLVAASAGALMYFATLTEVPIMQALIGAGMHRGPALALLLAGPSLSLPSLLVITGELGLSRALTYAALVVVFSTGAGFAYGSFF